MHTRFASFVFRFDSLPCSHSLAVGKVSKPRRGQPLVESVIETQRGMDRLCLSLRLGQQRVTDQTWFEDISPMHYAIASKQNVSSLLTSVFRLA